MDYYIDKPDIVKQLRAADPKNPTLEGYIYEAMRKAIQTRVWICANDFHCIGIDPPFRGVYRKWFYFTRCTSHYTCIGESLVDQTVGNLRFFKGQRVFVDLAHASQDVGPPNLSAYRSTQTTF